MNSVLTNASSPFFEYRHRCNCGSYVPKYVTPKNCFNCKQIAKQQHIEYCENKRLRDLEKKKQAEFRATFVRCSGFCGCMVPPHVNPKTCRYCSKLKICSGPCKQIVDCTITPASCSKCDLISFPFVKCEVDYCNVMVRKTTICQNCFKKKTLENYFEQLVKNYGEIDPTKLIVLEIKGVKNYGDDYFRYELVLPVFKNAIEECIKVRGDSIFWEKTVTPNRFIKLSPKSYNYDFTPIMKFYIKILDLEQVEYPGSELHGKFFVKPYIKKIKIVDYYPTYSSFSTQFIQ